MITNARQFVDEIAEILRTKGRGRSVEVIETEESFGTFVWRWYERSINLSARYSRRTKRWALGELNVMSTPYGKSFKETRRSSIRIAAEVYA